MRGEREYMSIITDPLLFTPPLGPPHKLTSKGDIELDMKVIEMIFWKSFGEDIYNLILDVDEVDLKLFSDNLFMHKMKTYFNMFSLDVKY